MKTRITKRQRFFSRECTNYTEAGLNFAPPRR